MTIAPIGPQICDRCRHVRAADAAWKHGLISEPEYRNYVRSEEPPYVGSFGYCKMVRTFVRH